MNLPGSSFKYEIFVSCKFCIHCHPINSNFTSWKIMIWNVKLLYIRIMINLHKESSTEIRPNNNIYKMHSLNKWHKKRHHKDRNANHTIKLLIFLKTIFSLVNSPKLGSSFGIIIDQTFKRIFTIRNTRAPIHWDKENESCR